MKITRKQVVEEYENGRRDFSSKDLSGLDLSGLDLRGADLSYANVSYADLKWADLRDANLYKTNGNWANLSGANLSEVNLDDADFRNCIGNRVKIKSMQLDTYNIVFTKDILAIGCKQHTHEEWENFTDDEIYEMDKGALKWWTKWKKIIFNIIRISD